MGIHKTGSASPTTRKVFVTLSALVGTLACSTDSLPTGAPSAPTEVETADVRRVASVDVTPGAVTVAAGATRQLAASARDSRGLVIGNAGVTWTSLDTLVATVNASGLVTAKSAGTAQVRAAANGFSDDAAVTVMGTATTPTPSPEPTPTPTPTPTLPADVIFSDDFESGTMSKWQDGVNAAKHRVVTEAGNRHLEVTYPSGEEGGWLTRFFMPGYDELYVRYDVKFDAAWQGGTKLLNLRGARTDNQWSAHGNAGKCPDGNQWFATNIVMMGQQDPGPIRFYAYWPGMPKENEGVTCWGRLSGIGTTNYMNESPISKGAWHRVEFSVKLNTPGQANGEQRVWVDGVLRGEWTGLVLRNTNMLKLNSLTLELSKMDGSESVTRRMYVDNVVVAPRR
jgi:hypothetical protein